MIMKRTAIAVLVLCLTASLAGCGGDAADTQNTAAETVTEAGKDSEETNQAEETEAAKKAEEEAIAAEEAEEEAKAAEAAKIAEEAKKQEEEAAAVQAEAEKEVLSEESDIPSDPDYDGLYAPIFEAAVNSEASDYCCAYFTDSNGDGVLEMWLDKGGEGSVPESYEVYTIRKAGAILVESGDGWVPYELNNDFPSPRARIDYGYHTWPGWETIMSSCTY